MIKLIILPVMAILLMGCGASMEDEKNLSSPGESSSGEYRKGETVYVCGCPMMCCNSISGSAEGRCACNMPMRRGIVTEIKNEILLVTVSGRDKIIFLNNR